MTTTKDRLQQTASKNDLNEAYSAGAFQALVAAFCALCTQMIEEGVVTDLDTALAYIERYGRNAVLDGTAGRAGYDDIADYVRSVAAANARRQSQTALN